MTEIIWILVGLFLGVLFTLNHKSYKEQKTLEQVDGELRKELELKTNLVGSLKQDLAYTKKKLIALKERTK